MDKYFGQTQTCLDYIKYRNIKGNFYTKISIMDELRLLTYSEKNDLLLWRWAFRNFYIHINTQNIIIKMKCKKDCLEKGYRV